MHKENHFRAADFLKDVVIGMADGLTVPFALAAGLSGAIDSGTIIITAGLAEIAAGSIAMGLGGYLAGKGETEHFDTEEQREFYEVEHQRAFEIKETYEIFEAYGLEKNQIDPIVKKFEADPKAWVDFMMRFELGLERPHPNRAVKSAVTIAGAYIIGGLVPLSPYFCLDVTQALLYSSIFTLVALGIFGYLKGIFMGFNGIKSALQTMFIGGLAASAAYFIATLLTQ